MSRNKATVALVEDKDKPLLRGGPLAGFLAAGAAWRRWRLDWQATPGTHWPQVRAEGRQGLQPTHQAPPYPAGTMGLHTVSVRVVPATGAGGGRARPARAMDRGVAQTGSTPPPLVARHHVRWAARRPDAP